MERADAIDGSVVYQEDRDDIFLARFTSDIATLLDAGIPPDIVKRVVCQYHYAVVWAACPLFEYPIRKLPKGYKWADGEKHSVKGRHGDARTIKLLRIGDDLYVHDSPLNLCVPGQNKSEGKGYVIRGLSKYTAVEVAKWYDHTMGDLILRKYKEWGLRQGLLEPVLRDVEKHGEEE